MTETEIEKISEAVARKIMNSGAYNNMARDFVKTALKELALQLELFADEIGEPRN